jgi:MFS transporter, FSR family, fosmidomycin resistance protein
METFLTLRRVRATAIFVLVILLIEFLDELVYSAREAALPLIRDDLNLSYDQIGLLLGVPTLFGNLVEPFMFFLTDRWERKGLVLGGAVIFGVELLVIAVAQDFGILLVGMLLLSPASGLFVGLAQASLMDSDPEHHEYNMARWTLAGSLGVVTGPLLLGGMLFLGGAWREVFALFALVTLGVILLVAWMPFPQASEEDEEDDKPDSLRGSLQKAWAALRHGTALRWLVLLQFADLLMDVLLSYLALYMVDVAKVSTEQAALAVAIWTGVGLAGDALLIPILGRMSGLRYLRFTVWAELILFPTFLLIPGYIPKLVVLGLLGFFNSGWYAILQGRFYSSMPGQSGAVLALGSLSGLVGGNFPLLIGLLAQRMGLDVAIWLLMAGPIVLLFGLPKGDAGEEAGLSLEELSRELD